jgi:hypothetical protein
MFYCGLSFCPARGGALHFTIYQMLKTSSRRSEGCRQHMASLQTVVLIGVQTPLNIWNLDSNGEQR